jgi:hypothetical protein
MSKKPKLTPQEGQATATSFLREMHPLRKPGPKYKRAYKCRVKPYDRGNLKNKGPFGKVPHPWAYEWEGAYAYFSIVGGFSNLLQVGIRSLPIAWREIDEYKVSSTYTTNFLRVQNYLDVASYSELRLGLKKLLVAHPKVLEA